MSPDIKLEISNMPTAMQLSPKSTISFWYIENFLHHLSVTETNNIQWLLTSFEVLTDSSNSSHVQIFIFVERVLKGLALLFVQNESYVTTEKNITIRIRACLVPSANSKTINQPRLSREFKNWWNIFCTCQKLWIAAILTKCPLYTTYVTRFTSQNKDLLFRCTNLPKFKQKLFIPSTAVTLPRIKINGKWN